MKHSRLQVFAGIVFALMVPARMLAQATGRGVEVAVTYTAERAEITPSTCNCFWFSGGGAEVSATLFHGWGAAAEMTGLHASNVAPGVDVNKVSYLFGPRYTIGLAPHGHAGSIFGEALFGAAHGFNSVFPAASGPTSTANSFQFQIGGGAQVHLKGALSFRVVELDYVRTAFPNAGGNVQNDLRVATGLAYRFGK